LETTSSAWTASDVEFAAECDIDTEGPVGEHGEMVVADLGNVGTENFRGLENNSVSVI